MNRKRLFQTIGLVLRRGAPARGRYLKDNCVATTDRPDADHYKDSDS